MGAFDNLTDLDPMVMWPSFIGVVVIALVHLCSPRFRFLRKPDNPWLPVSAGVALAYVFMDIFPHLAKKKLRLTDADAAGLYKFLAANVYLMALLGFCVYLGVGLLSQAYRQGSDAADGLGFGAVPTVVKSESVSLAAYNFIIGYLLAEQPTHGAQPVLIFAVAMAIHFVGVDHLLREQFRNLYDRTARYFFVVALAAGWIAGLLIELPDPAFAIVFAFLAGGIVVIAAVYELPRIRSTKQYLFFVAGAALFSALVLASELPA